MASSLWDTRAEARPALQHLWQRCSTGTADVAGTCGMCPNKQVQDVAHPSRRGPGLPGTPEVEGSWGSLAGPCGPYLGREQRWRTSLASSAAEHHAAPQALPLVVTCSRALPSLSELPAGKGASDPSSTHRLAAPGGAGAPGSLAAARQARAAAEGRRNGLCPGSAQRAQPD